MISKKFCPNCGSEDVMMMVGGITGSWICKKCGFNGTVFPEKEIVGKDIEGRDKDNFVKKVWKGNKLCPKCKSENVDFIASAEGVPIGYVCKDCGHQGNVFPEKEEKK